MRSGVTFAAAPALTLLVAGVWGITVIADSAQFSTAVTELSPPAYVGTALTTQQVQAMKRHSGRIVVNFDPDAAGANATAQSGAAHSRTAHIASKRSTSVRACASRASRALHKSHLGTYRSAPLGPASFP